jgi:N-acetyl-gamma-glutamyl-phosphate reductase
MATATILGCSGYTGQETLDRVLAHPGLEVDALGSDSLAGELASALDIRLNGSLPAFVSNADALASGADVLFVCLGHEEAAALEPPTDAVVVDLSGAHRLRDSALYDRWYGFTHPRAEALANWSYALPELYPPTGMLIASPGCYATAVLLALAPLADSLDPESVVVDAKSGVSGAGRSPKPIHARNPTGVETAEGSRMTVYLPGSTSCGSCESRAFCAARFPIASGSSSDT